MKPLFIFAIIIGVPLLALGQAPVIQNVEPIYAAPNDTIVITGSGFNNTPSNLDVWFGPVKGTVISSSEYAIEVRVPPQATVRSVRVVNRVTRLSADSPLKFTPSLRTEAFNAADFSSTPVTFTAPEELWDLCTCDLNADGKPDIAATKFTTPSSPFAASTDIMLLQNNSAPGTLTAASFQKFDKTNMPVLNLTFGTDHVVCGDLQGDGYPELVVTRAGPTRNSIHIFRNTSVGTTLNFATVAPLLLDVGHFATRLVLRDLNRDGKPEIIATNSFNDLLYIFVNQSSAGTLVFNTTPIKLSIKIAAGDALTTYESDIVDLNGDDLPDIVINQFQTNDLYILRNQSTGTVSFAPPQKISLPAGLNRITSADFNKDGKPDLATTSTLNNQLDILINQTATGATSFAFAPSISMITSTGPWGLDVTDIDGDGDPDVAIANRNQTALSLFVHNGNFANPGFTKVDVPTPLPARNIKLGDIDGDGKPEITYTAFNNATQTTQVGIIRNASCHKPVIENEGPLVICNGQSIVLKTAPANNVTFAWTKDGAPIGGNNHYVTITAPGTYQVVATGEGGACTEASPSVVVTADAASAPANPTITANAPLCIGSTLNLQTETVPGAIYAWTGPNNFSSASEDPSIPSVTDDHAGIYSVQVQVGQCKSDVVTKRIDVARLADFNITSNNATNTVCSGNSVSLSVSNPGGHTYQWIKDGTDIGTATNPTFAASQEGIYTVRVENTALNCAIVTSGVTVTVLAAPVAAYSSNASGCTGQEIVFTNESQADARATVLNNWNFGDGFNATTASPTHSYTSAQTFNASLTVSYQGVTGCSDNETKGISIVSATQPSITASATSACPEGNVNLSVAGAFASVLWSNAASGPSVEVAPGTYTVNTVDPNGCPGQDQIVIAALEKPALAASADPPTIAPGATSQLTASGAVAYVWSPAESLSDPNIENPIASPLVGTIYRVIGTSAAGCRDSLDVKVTVSNAGNFPPAFSPNGDGRYDTWNIRAESSPECTLTVFDGRGRRIFEGKGQNWDGTYQGNPVPDGTYYYVYGCPDEEPVTGSVLVFK